MSGSSCKTAGSECSIDDLYIEGDEDTFVLDDDAFVLDIDTDSCIQGLDSNLNDLIGIINIYWLILLVKHLTMFDYMIVLCNLTYVSRFLPKLCLLMFSVHTQNILFYFVLQLKSDSKYSTLIAFVVSPFHKHL